MFLDNSDLVAKFCPPIGDGDTFIYTEMIDRGAKKGNNNRNRPGLVRDKITGHLPLL